MFTLNLQRIAFSVLLTLASTVLLSAQRLIGEIPVSGKIGSIQAFPLGDSILLSFYEKTADSFLRKDYWCREGKVRKTRLSSIGNQPLLAITQHQGKPYLYSVSGKRSKQILQASDQDSTRVVLTADDLDGELAAVFNDEILYVVTINPKHNEINIFGISGFEIVSRQNFTSYFDLPGGMPAAIGENEWCNAETNYVPYKLYKHGKKLTILFDKIQYEPAEGFTLLQELDIITGEKRLVKIPGWHLPIFRSTLYHGNVYRVSAVKQEIDVSVYDGITGKPTMSQIKIPNEEAFKKQLVTARHNNIILRRNANLYRVIATARNVQLSVTIAREATDSTHLELMVGTYYNDEKMMPMFALNPIATLASVAVTAAINEMVSKKYQAHYFYMRQDTTEKFERIKDDTSLSFQASIDHYEITQQQHYGTAYKFKGYLKTGDDAVAVYYLPRENKITVMGFGPSAGMPTP